MRYHPGNGFAALSREQIICLQLTGEQAGEGVAVVASWQLSERRLNKKQILSDMSSLLSKYAFIFFIHQLGGRRKRVGGGRKRERERGREGKGCSVVPMLLKHFYCSKRALHLSICKH